MVIFFTARRYVSAVYAVVVCMFVCLSGSASVCLSQDGGTVTVTTVAIIYFLPRGAMLLMLVR